MMAPELVAAIKARGVSAQELFRRLLWRRLFLETGYTPAQMVEWIVNAPRWLLLAALVYAPWADGSTRAWTVAVLNILLGTTVILWLAGCLARRAWPSIHRIPLVVSVVLILQAWWMVLNAKSEYDSTTLHYLPLTPLLSWAPGTLHRSLSLPMALRVSALLGVGCFCCDLARRPVWRTRLLWTMALTGLSLVLLGLIQRLSGATGIFWGPPDQGQTFFATYRYHANAGAFLNLAWPLTAGLLLTSFGRDDNRRERTFWIAALVLCLAGVFVNASRAANLIAVGLIVVWLGRLLWKRHHSLNRPPVKPAILVITILSVVMVLAGLAAFGGLDTTLRRWGKFNEELSARNPRLLVAQVCMRMLPDAGCWGFGPGTFQTVFPYYTTELGDEISGIWYYAHDDYLQTLLEWGWLGGALWAVYLLGGMTFSWLTVIRHPQQLSSTDRMNFFAILTALLGLVVHASMDYPLQVASIELYGVVLLGMLWSCRSWIGKSHVLNRLEKRLEASSS